MDWSNLLVSGVTPDILGLIIGEATAVGIVENGIILTGRKDVVTATILGETQYIVNEDDRIYTMQAENRMVIFGGQPGPSGEPGQAATIRVGTVTTLPAGSSATVVNSGTPEAAVFDFGIPKGDTGSGSNVDWGDITGTLSNQTDLQNALDDKADTSSLGTMASVNDASSDNKIYGRKNGAWAEVTGGGGGSAEWGDITGTLSNQTDLQNALYAKANSVSITEEFSSTKSYPAGWNYVYHNGYLFKFTGPYQGSFDNIPNITTATVFDLLALKAPLDSPSLTGTPTAPTASSGTSTTQIATTAFVQGEISGKADTADLGDLAYEDSVDYSDVTNTPTLGALASQDTVDYDTEITNKPTLGNLASQDTVDYSTEVTNKPTLGTMAAVNDAPSDGEEYVRKNGSWAVSSGITGVDWGDIGGTLADQTDLNTALSGKQSALTFDNAPTSGSSNPVTSDGIYDALDLKANTADLGDLASQDTVDYDTEVTNKPTLGALAGMDSIDYTSAYLTNTPTLGALADQDTVDYLTEVTNTPTLGTMASKDDAASDNVYYLRRNAGWADADDRYALKSNLMFGSYLLTSPDTSKTIYQIYQAARTSYGTGVWQLTIMVGQIGSTTVLGQSLPVIPSVVTIVQYNHSSQERAVLTCQGVSTAVIKHCYIWQGSIASWY